MLRATRDAWDGSRARRESNIKRASGILLHPTSLPGPFGIGDLGPIACRFADFLQECGQTLWQVLPLGATGYGNSPYMCFSAFAGNPFLVSLERLAEEGLLDAKDLANPPAFSTAHVDYPRVFEFKRPLLLKAFRRFHALVDRGYPTDYYAFCERNAPWLEDYALFMALKHAHNGSMWHAWDEDLAQRDTTALVALRNSLGEEIQFRKFVQYTFFRQWAALRGYCRERGVRIIGDIPIYVAYDSADVWAHREQFHLDERGRPTVVAGVPPDYFSATGQRWGNPIYRWERMAQTGYDWWIERFRHNLGLADLLRLDHFRGFESYWEIGAGEETAVNGRWTKGPGAVFFEAVELAMGKLPVIAEDLGVITPEVDALRERLGFPGMRILQMAFGGDPKAPTFLPHNYDRNCVVYTATHDHNTSVGWFTAPPGAETTQSAEEIEEERRSALAYLGSDGREIHWDFIRLAMGSVAPFAIFPLQDVLGLGASARMNRPGTLRGNWEWRFGADALSADMRQRLLALTRTYGRHPDDAAQDVGPGEAVAARPRRGDLRGFGSDQAMPF